MALSASNNVMRAHISTALLSVLLTVGSVGWAQPWSGIISPTRATDWRQAGLPAGLPDANWTQCGQTIAAYDGSPDAISTQIQSCATNQFVLLGPGTFHLKGSIDFGRKDHVVLRGAGANSTFLVFSGASQVNCNLGTTALIALCSKDQTDMWSNPPVYRWTDGPDQGSTQLTLDSNSGIAPGSMLFLSQNDDGYTGYNPTTGSSIDNNGYFVCADKYQTNPTTGCAYDGPDGTYPNPFTHRWQYEAVVVTAVNGNLVTITPPIKHPNWRASQVPTAMRLEPLESSGVENLSIDVGNSQDTGYGIDIWACNGCWVSGVTVKNFYNWGIAENWSVHGQYQNNYIYNGDGTGPDSYGMRFSTTADNLVVNNIFHHIRSSITFDEPDAGTVVAYNYSVNQWVGADAMFLAFWPHSAGDDFELFEGNVSDGVVMDSSHGSHLNQTLFRNFSTGWESCANGNCGTNTAKDWGASPLVWPFDMRYGNVIANVSGTPGFHSVYQNAEFNGCASGACAIYTLGGTNESATIPSDPLVPATMLRWANWDTVTNATHFCGDASNTGWASVCAATSEVPTSAPNYPNSVPSVGDTAAGQAALPASFYYTTKPAWFGDIPFPPVGPDVNNGNVGQCAGTLNMPGQFAGLPATDPTQCVGTSLGTAWAGHVNAIPAMACYLAMGGLPDGTGPLLPFDASACYEGKGTISRVSDAGTSATDSGSSQSGNCGCRFAGSSSASSGLLGFVALALLWRRRATERGAAAISR